MMASAPGYNRDYKREKVTSDARGEKPKRANRNRARLIVKKKLGSAAIKGKDVAHLDNDTKNNSKSNLKPQAKAQNRSVKGKRTTKRK